MKRKINRRGAEELKLREYLVVAVLGDGDVACGHSHPIEYLHQTQLGVRQRDLRANFSLRNEEKKKKKKEEK